MTAFARVSLAAGGKHWAVEIRSLNQRYFELSLRLPPAMYPLEPQVRQLAQSVMRRGKVTLSVAEEGRNGGSLVYELDPDQVKAYLASAKKIKAKFKLDGKLTVEEIMRLPGVVKEKPAEDVEAWTWIKRFAIRKKKAKSSTVISGSVWRRSPRRRTGLKRLCRATKKFILRN
jgi:uncharacterized protein (TIGR00255 family)